MTPTTKHRVLVVDDNRDAATTMSHLLSLAGFEVETFFDGHSALAAVTRFRPEACLLDISMPGMDGYELARQLRARCADHPPLFATMTAYGHDSHLEKAVESGFDLQFTKPADPHELIEQLKAGITQGHLFANDEPVDEPVGAADQTSRKSRLHRLLTRLRGLWSKEDPAPRPA
jgi:CheY-like chemotaxis protein